MIIYLFLQSMLIDCAGSQALLFQLSNSNLSNNTVWINNRLSFVCSTQIVYNGGIGPRVSLWNRKDKHERGLYYFVPFFYTVVKMHGHEKLDMREREVTEYTLYHFSLPKQHITRGEHWSWQHQPDSNRLKLSIIPDHVMSATYR